MLNLLKALRQDEHGVILSVEIVIVGTVLVIGLMTGMACLQKSVNNELGDFAQAIDNFDQSYSFSGLRKAGGNNRTGNCFAFTAGSAFMNHECNANVCQNSIVGCERCMNPQSGICGTCGSCGGQCGVSGVCGSCGISGTDGYGYGYGTANRPDCVSTGVPKMKVTEYPGTSIVPRTTNEGRSALRFPGLEGPIHSHPPFERRPQDGEFHPGGEFHEPGPYGPVPNVPGSADINELLRPIPQDQPLPVTPPPEPQP